MHKYIYKYLIFTKKISQLISSQLKIIRVFLIFFIVDLYLFLRIQKLLHEFKKKLYIIHSNLIFRFWCMNEQNNKSQYTITFLYVLDAGDCNVVICLDEFTDPAGCYV